MEKIMKSDNLTGTYCTLIEVKGLEFEISGSCDGVVEDQGIGSYEFWGAHYTDTCWVNVVTNHHIESIYLGKHDVTNLIKRQYPNIWEKLSEELEEQMANDEIITWSEIEFE